MTVGSYKKIRRLGCGGFGEVWEVMNMKTQKKWALKKMRFDNLDEANSCLREAMLMLKLHHPRVVTCNEVFLHREHEDLFVCITMPLYPEGDLLRHVKSAPCPVAMVQRVLYDVSSALAYVHTEGFVHRDLKPQNIFIAKGPDGQEFHLADFGLCKDAEATTRSVAGTPFYMAPEQYEGKEYNGQVDMWALGVILLFLLVPQSALRDKRPLHRIASSHTTARFDAYLTSLLTHTAPADLAAIVKSLLSPDPSKRPSASSISLPRATPSPPPPQHFDPSPLRDSPPPVPPHHGLGLRAAPALPTYINPDHFQARRTPDPDDPFMVVPSGRGRSPPVPASSAPPPLKWPRGRPPDVATTPPAMPAETKMPSPKGRHAHTPPAPGGFQEGCDVEVVGLRTCARELNGERGVVEQLLHTKAVVLFSHLGKKTIPLSNLIVVSPSPTPAATAAAPSVSCRPSKAASAIRAILDNPQGIRGMETDVLFAALKGVADELAKAADGNREGIDDALEAGTLLAEEGMGGRLMGSHGVVTPTILLLRDRTFTKLPLLLRFVRALYAKPPPTLPRHVTVQDVLHILRLNPQVPEVVAEALRLLSVIPHDDSIVPDVLSALCNLPTSSDVAASALSLLADAGLRDDVEQPCIQSLSVHAPDPNVCAPALRLLASLPNRTPDPRVETALLAILKGVEDTPDAVLSSVLEVASQRCISLPPQAVKSAVARLCDAPGSVAAPGLLGAAVLLGQGRVPTAAILRALHDALPPGATVPPSLAEGMGRCAKVTLSPIDPSFQSLLITALPYAIPAPRPLAAVAEALSREVGNCRKPDRQRLYDAGLKEGILFEAFHRANGATEEGRATKAAILQILSWLVDDVPECKRSLRAGAVVPLCLDTMGKYPSCAALVDSAAHFLESCGVQEALRSSPKISYLQKPADKLQGSAGPHFRRLHRHLGCIVCGRVSAGMILREKGVKCPTCIGRKSQK